MTIAVLGAGMVGRAIALDLAKEHTVTSFDLDAGNLQELKTRDESIQTVGADLSQFTEYGNLFAPFDIIITAVPGFMGYKTLEAAINAGKNVVDISFFPEDALQLDHLAKQKNVTAITDCGVAPGVSNFIIGRYNEEMKIDSFECYVGGLPVQRKPPFQYKAPFSPVDVIQEYIRPARLIEDGVIVTKPALSERELMQFDEVGELEAFNTDGLRSLIFTMGHIPEMKEKTLRYPGHIDLIIALQQAGFFNTTPLRINETDITPLDFTSKLLVNEWKPGPEEEEFTVMKVIIKGEGKTIEYDLFDRYDKETQTSSMARTTGYTCTAAVNLIAKDLFIEKGVFPPELVGRHKNCFEFVMNYLAERRVSWTMKQG
ncbi:MAG TPA: saccharopine dehydrogenase C-terminal domain-containing protein [Chitinophagaceae bacterium]|jgi:saccharopine dehydrogenase-like NADP-dependent oxidoreductase|nr:saccharopine dehydrogenase C-terminal domain-containing protein [Chitinophagaceae bacterium]